MSETPEPATDLIDPDLLAALDLGSNSFHLIVAREEHGELRVVDREKEMVRLAAGLDAEGVIDEATQSRAIECLQRFGQRLRHVAPNRMRAVGTNTLRAADNAEDFLARAEAALGHNISIIAGIEEARLVFLGAAHSLAALGHQRLVVDIGGGSTELIIGQRYEPIAMDSLYMGCVSLSRRFFEDGVIDAKRMRRAETAALQELEPLMQRYHQMGWSEAVGTSGTIRAVRNVVQARGWCEEGITARSLDKLVDALIAAGDTRGIEGLSAQRAPVFAGGVAILHAVFQALDIEHMRYADGALREGVLYDLLGRLHNEDARERSVESIAGRFGVDAAQAERVTTTALALLRQVAGAWDLLEPRAERMLRWAARLHEIGTTVAYHHYHRHGAYIIENADMAGFSNQQQRVLAAIVRAHRRKFPGAEFKALPKRWRTIALRLAVVLRLAVALNRSRSPQMLPPAGLRVIPKGLAIAPDAEWLTAHPLTRADLETEREGLARAGITLEIDRGPDPPT
ncbi:MAG: exopolyphosphatase [Chromatiales bacterium]|nr:exopolyphosphatase [Chromatiales bacterium]